MIKYISTRIYSFDACNKFMDCIQTRTQRPLQDKSTCIYILSWKNGCIVRIPRAGEGEEG